MDYGAAHRIHIHETHKGVSKEYSALVVIPLIYFNHNCAGDRDRIHE